MDRIILCQSDRASFLLTRQKSRQLDISSSSTTVSCFGDREFCLFLKLFGHQSGICPDPEDSATYDLRRPMHSIAIIPYPTG